MHAAYSFPEKDPFRALEVTEPEFDILAEQAYEPLYVDFSSVRTQRYKQRMKMLLGMDHQTNQLGRQKNKFCKIIFSGHRGCGKTLELQRFRDEINHSNGYLALYINLEAETEIQRFEPEDLYIILITVLVRELERISLPIQYDILNEIAEEWLQESELRKELSHEYGLEAAGEVSLGWKFWNFLGVQGKFKGVYAQHNATTRTIRQKIKLNQIPLIDKLNDFFDHLRETLAHYHGRGYARDLVFIVDGLEKTLPEIHETLFVKDIQLMRRLDVHIISCVPIQTFYEAHHPNTATFFEHIYLPMIRITDESIPVLREIITRRLDPSLLNEGILDEMVEKSGGCPRLLLHIVHEAILEALGEPVDQAVADKTYRKLGNLRWQTLTKADKAAIRSGAYDDADPIILDLLFQLQLLEYNGEHPERKLNPLLSPFFTQPDA